MLPQLEYASAVWDPHLNKDIKACEAVQRQAARFVTNTYRDRAPGSMTRLLDELQWDTLESRRQDARLTLFYKGLRGSMALPMLQSLAVPERATRTGRRFMPPEGPRSTYRRRSFLPRTVKDWNNLTDNSVNAQTVNAFKSSLHQIH